MTDLQASIVLSIKVKSVDEFLSVIEREEAGFYELRVDGLGEWKGVEKLRPFREELIITIRTKGQGGFRMMDDDERVGLFRRLLELKPAFVDIEYDTPLTEEFIELVGKRDVDVILSYHDTDKTPSRGRLREILKEMKGLNPDIIKIVTFAEEMDDNLLLSELYELHGFLIAFCMGKKGRISRLLSLYFAPMTYVTLKGMETAPGQLSMEDVRTIEGVMR